MTMARRHAVRPLLAAALVIAASACEDRSAPDDVPHARSGGIARRPGPEAGGSRVSVAESGQPPTGTGTPSPQAPGGGGFGDGNQAGAGAGGATAGAGGGSAGVSGGMGGNAGIPGIGGIGGSAGIPAPTTADPEDATVGDALGGADDTATGGGGGSDFGDFGAAAGASGALGIGGSVGAVGTNLAPIASFTLSPPCVSEIQTAVTLASSSVDPDGDSLRCSWEVPAAVPSSSEDCTVTVTLFDVLESPVVLFVSDGERISSAIAEIGPCAPGSAIAP